MGRPEVSVVIPTRDRAELVVTTVRSALNQRDVDVEVIVVDDGSSDNTVGSLGRVRDERLRLVRHREPSGVSVARNSGIACSSSPWVAFVDDDDLFAPDKLRSQLAAMRESSGAQWSCVGVVVVNASLRVAGWIPTPAATDLAVEMLQHDAIPGGGSGVVVSRRLIDEVGRFDPAFSCQADWETWLRLAQRSPIAAVNRPLLAYRVHRTAMSLDVDTCDREVDALRTKHADLMVSEDVEPDLRAWELSKVMSYVRAGRRTQALRLLYALARQKPRPPRLARLALVSAVPGSLTLNDERLRWGVPKHWRTEAEAWLDGYRGP